MVYKQVTGWPSHKAFLRTPLGLQEAKSKGAFYLSWELTGQTIPVAMISSVLIQTLQPDQSNPK